LIQVAWQIVMSLRDAPTDENPQCTQQGTDTDMSTVRGKKEMTRVRSQRRSIAIAGLAALVASGVLGSASARACALDNKPSLSANGRLVRINQQYPRTDAEVAHWTYFVVPGAYHVGQGVALTENRQEVAQTLLPSVMLRPWRWELGDGAVAYGWSVKHVYAHPGQYMVTADCYNPGDGKWYNFDKATLTVTR